ncbi:hypothetical protein MC885_008208 [Smutsia gigantea]|nr:hypothetical protein MC885_008208 [Smutsia gigantea]
MQSSAEVITALQSHGELSEFMVMNNTTLFISAICNHETASDSSLEDSAAVSSTVPEMAQGDPQWFQEAESE